jgi:hypothetical protein
MVQREEDEGREKKCRERGGAVESRVVLLRRGWLCALACARVRPSARMHARARRQLARRYFRVGRYQGLSGRHARNDQTRSEYNCINVEALPPL